MGPYSEFTFRSTIEIGPTHAHFEDWKDAYLYAWVKAGQHGYKYKIQKSAVYAIGWFVYGTAQYVDRSKVERAAIRKR